MPSLVGGCLASDVRTVLRYRRKRQMANLIAAARRKLIFAFGEIQLAAIAAGESVWWPGAALSRLNSVRASILVLLCLSMHLGFFKAVVWSQPEFLITLYQRGDDSVATRDSAEQRLEAHSKKYTKSAISDCVTFVVALTAFWFVTGGLAFGERRALPDVFRAVALGEVASTIGSLTTLVLWVLLERSPGRFTLAWLVPRGSAAAEYLGGISIFTVWWCVLVSVGLASAWRRPLKLVLPLVLLATIGWLFWGHHLHQFVFGIIS